MKKFFILAVFTGLLGILYAKTLNYYGCVFEDVPYFFKKGDFIGKTEEIRVVEKGNRIKKAVLIETFYVLTKKGKFYIGKVWAGSLSAIKGRPVKKTDSIMLIQNFFALFKKSGGALGESPDYKILRYLNNIDTGTARSIIREALNKGTDILNIAEYKNGIIVITGKKIRPENIKISSFKKDILEKTSEVLRNPFFFPKRKGKYKIIIIKEK